MKWRLLAAFAGLITLVLVAQDVPLANYLRQIEKERLTSNLERDAFLLSGGATPALAVSAPDVPAQADIEAIQKAVDDYAKRSGARVVVVDRDGNLVVSSDATDQRGENYLNGNRPEIAAALEGDVVDGERFSATVGGNLVYVAVPVVFGGEWVGAVRITYPAEVIDTRANEKVRGLLLVGAISLALAALAAVLIANSITSPLRRLQRSTEKLAEGDFSERAPLEGAPELRGLATSFNSMTQRISRLLDQQKAFAGDASHQLRTPLTALRLQLERAAEMVDTDPEGARERVEAASEETERLQRLVEALLMIARSEGATADTEPVDVTALVHDRAEVWAPFAGERGVTLLTSAPDGLWVTAMPNALEQIVDNYVDNALGVAREGDTIYIVAMQHHDAIGVHVIDEGPGMRPEHLEHAFDRFWRAPDAPHGGSGIGLAVVQHLAQLSGGRAELRNRTDRTGLDACVLLPTLSRT
jgi:signal transduction histidine kinase